MKLGGHLVCPAVPAVDPRPVTMAIAHRVVELVHHSVRRLERHVACMAEELPTVGVEKPRGCRRVPSPLGGAGGAQVVLDAPVAAPASQAVVKLKVQRERAEARV